MQSHVTRKPVRTVSSWGWSPSCHPCQTSQPGSVTGGPQKESAESYAFLTGSSPPTLDFK